MRVILEGSYSIHGDIFSTPKSLTLARVYNQRILNPADSPEKKILSNIIKTKIILNLFFYMLIFYQIKRENYIYLL